MKFPFRQPPSVEAIASLKTTTASLLSRWQQRLPKKHCFWIGLSLGIGVGGLGWLGWETHRLEASLPATADNVLTYARPETIFITAADGTVLQTLGPATRQTAKLTDIPPILQQAFIASEDRRFYQHHGIDYQGIARAALTNLQALEIIEGGSTITQQLARIVYLDQQRNLNRKLREMRLAQRIEQQFSKDQILERYLNLVYLGSGAYGIADAARLYFNKPVSQLTALEAATLAGLTPAPSDYSPLVDPQLATRQRDRVLAKMAQAGYLSDSQAQTLSTQPLTLQPGPLNRLQRQAPYFSDYVRQQLPKLLKPEVLQAGGIRVETTLNPHWQQSAEAAIAKVVREQGKGQQFQQASLVAIDPRTGAIQALVGGIDYRQNQFNRAVQAQRQPGSTFKTFVYATAIAAGISPYKSFYDADYVIDGYRPRNYNNRYRYAYVSLHNALAASLNVIAVQTLVDVGWKPTIKIAHQLGIESELAPTYSLALGASEVNLLELTSAYGTLANRGQRHAPFAIQRILDREGKILYAHQSQEKTAIDSDTAAIVTWMLQDVVNAGTGQPARLGRPVAGKTGTSDQARDLWFVGYIPQLVTGVWLGNDDNQPTQGASTTAAATWREFMLKVVPGLSVEPFPQLPQLEGRKGTIKAEPVKPKRTYYVSTAPQSSSTPRRRYRQYAQNSTPSYAAPRRSRSRRSTYSAPPAAAPTPAPVITATPEPTPAPAIAKPAKELSPIPIAPVPESE